jgi:hypothetical protein
MPQPQVSIFVRTPSEFVAVLPLKSGEYRVSRLSLARYTYWLMAWRDWYLAEGHRYAHSPEFWPYATLEESTL